jgi:predicted dehydrogenase
MSETIGIGIVGYGKAGALIHMRWIDERDDVQLTAVCDTTPARRAAAAEEHPEITVYEDYDRFLDDREVDLVIVTTPPTTHHDLTVRACRAGKHVFVDKPFAMNLHQAEEMLGAAREAGVVIHCHQSRRWDSEYQRILACVREGMIGEVKHLRRIWTQYGESWTSWGIEGFNPTWRIQREYGGGMVYDYAPHCGDQILYLMDVPLVEVYSDVRSLKFSREVDDHFSCLLRFENGSTAYLEASNMLRLPFPHWYVVGTEGCLSADAVDGEVLLLRDGSDEPEIMTPIAMRNELYENLIASCRSAAQPNVRPDELRASMKLIDAIFASASKRESVRLR